MEAHKHEKALREESLSSIGVHPGCAAYTGKPLRVLCLHGMGGTADLMINKKMGGVALIKQYCGSLVEFVGVDAPHPIGETKPGSQKPGYVWFPQINDKAVWEATWAKSLSTLEDAIRTQGPFDGVLGFSMGAACAPVLLAAVPEGTFRFIIVCDGYLPLGKNYDGAGFPGQSIVDLLARRKPIKTPALFTMSKNNHWPTSGDMVMAFFDAPEKCYHVARHNVPKDEASLKQIAEFLLNAASNAQLNAQQAGCEDVRSAE